ncbi:modular serine protease-like [Rhagoletis pomonella]|uniref:modular serine protease-like n=1 Tax=Rhagoletis pomonella TaxID=28610 RepID=UPI001783358A|nr:modular serine protease-like [Rhagoletis pomonella]
MACVKKLCKNEHYRCAYGACIRAELKCNKQADCHDRSDETELLCGSDDEVWAQIQGSCTDEEYQCSSGECIDVFAMCDGRPDCSDASDETVSACAHIICPDYSFRCGYGACISVEEVCNKIWDCADGSDELCSVDAKQYELAKDKDAETTTNSQTCRIPFEKSHLEVRHGNTKKLLSYFDKILKNETVEFRCSTGFELIGVDSLKCVNNNWYRQWPECKVSASYKLMRSAFSVCYENSAHCDNGDCIDQSDLCNGLKDCTDGSDETPARCFGRNCTDSEFQCKYGACIPIKSICDKRQHCADGSDETRLLCTKDEDDYYSILQGGCDYEDEELAECLSGECIPQAQLCDGIPHCSDRSDETLQMCAHIKCPNTDFSCAYGACIPSSAQCNGRVDCADGSDEMAEICRYVEAERAKHEEETNFDDSYEANIDKIEAIEEDRAVQAKEEAKHDDTADSADIDKIRKTAQEILSPTILTGVVYRRCTIPVDRVALRAILAAENATLKVGSQVNIGAIVTFSCDYAWQLVGGESELLCLPVGEWSTIVPRCEKRCPPQWSGISTTIKCTYHDDTVDCGTYHKPGTKAVLQCAQGYGPILQRAELRCGDDGEWDAPKFKCQPQCAIASSESVEPKKEMSVDIYKLRANEGRAQYLRFHWACKGTIISPKLVLTSALCFSYNDLPGIAANDPTIYSILTGSTEIGSFGQYEKRPNSHNVSEIILANGFDASDLEPPAIAVLVDYFVIFPAVVMPICMQFKRSCLDKTNKQFPVDSSSDMKGVAFSSDGCLVVIGHSELIYMDKYQQWLEIQVFRYKYLL